jgi:hypothetical protein
MYVCIHVVCMYVFMYIYIYIYTYIYICMYVYVYILQEGMRAATGLAGLAPAPRDAERHEARGARPEYAHGV